MTQGKCEVGKLLYEELTYKIIGAAREGYFQLGPGYLESVYEDALCYELETLKMQQPQAEAHRKSVSSSNLKHARPRPSRPSGVAGEIPACNLWASDGGQAKQILIAKSKYQNTGVPPFIHG